MRIIRGFKDIKQKFKKPVLTMGMFDGVHLGHQKIIKEVVGQAKAIGGTSIVLTFDPHPLNVLYENDTAPLITSVKHRIKLIGKMKVDICVIINFNRTFSQISARKFIENILVDTIGVDTIIVGQGFRFGKNKKGSISFLKKVSKIYGFKVRRINAIKKHGQAVSSSRIRSFIKKGKIDRTNSFLGRRFSICGTVRKGVARGRILGYPTANILPQQEIVPASGVYAVLVKLDKRILPGIINIGARPTFESRKNSVTIEVHIFNFCKNIYGKTLEIFFIHRIRAEKRFFSQSALLERIKKDELKAKKILKARKSHQI